MNRQYGYLLPNVVSSRILVVGNSGSGKTTLSRRLANLSGIPLYDLDDYYWWPNWTAINPNEWEQEVKAMTSQESWIISGTFPDTLPLRLGCADLVIFLDLPMLRCLWRVILRDVQRYFGNRRSLPRRIRHQAQKPRGGEGPLRFWLSVVGFPKLIRPLLTSRLANPNCEVITLRTQKEVDDWLEKILQ